MKKNLISALAIAATIGLGTPAAFADGQFGHSPPPAEAFGHAPPSPPIDPANFPKAGDVVVDQSGNLSPNFFEKRICSVNPCYTLTIDKRTQAVAAINRQWTNAFALTGHGSEIARKVDFSNAELPKAEAQQVDKNAGLGIRKVSPQTGMGITKTGP